MKLHLHQSESNTFTRYGPGFVEVNKARHDSSLIVTAGGLEAWPVRDVASLDAQSFASIPAQRPELVIIGTGRNFKFPSHAALRPLQEARIGYEVMDTGAACRTYNVLISEGRAVLAAVIVD